MIVVKEGGLMRRSIRLLTAASGAVILLATPALAQEAASLSVGDEIKGELTADDPASGAEGEKRTHDAYRVTANAGQRLEVVMESDDLDAYLELYDAEGNLIDEDDDGGPGTGARTS